MFTTAQTDLDFEARLDLITRGLGKIDDLAFIQNTLREKNTPALFWGVAPTGRREWSSYGANTCYYVC
ncbi:hypothetical protein TWF679_006789 [Orbilia oligospora]|uniref:Uncharacterized protein n=1 Tax=Orbilia oligospora TaxID=2813651 RepID=A0A8H8V8M7_ORBOL|nr:hypothetical protein TWF679_006789 [Orbilia oligospora]